MDATLFRVGTTLTLSVNTGKNCFNTAFDLSKDQAKKMASKMVDQEFISKEDMMQAAHCINYAIQEYFVFLTW